MTPYLPNELILEIISRLPPQNAMQLCCMSKGWHSKLTSSQFRTLHFNNFTRNKRATLLWRDSVRNIDCFTILKNSQAKNLLRCPTNCAALYELVGILNGVVCLADMDLGTDDVCIWNPIIKRLVFIPPYQNLDASIAERPLMLSLGFAHEEPRNQYKIFCVITFLNEEWMPKLGDVLMDVFSFGTGVWTNVRNPEDLQYALASRSFGVFHEDSCHWAVYGRSNWDFEAKPYVLRVRACDNICSLLGLPDAIHVRMVRSTVMATIQGCLALIPCPSPGLLAHDGPMNVWIMVEYGDEASWFVRFRIVGEVNLREWPVGEVIVLARSGGVLNLTNRRDGVDDVVDVMLADEGFYVGWFSESLELFGKGRPLTCFCPT